MSFQTGARYPYTGTAGAPVRTCERWQGGGASTALAAVAKLSGRNITGVAFVSTGRYTVTFRNVGAQFLGIGGTVASAAGATNTFVVREVVGSYSATAKTVDITICDLATPTLHDLATTEFVRLEAEWSDTDQP